MVTIEQIAKLVMKEYGLQCGIAVHVALSVAQRTISNPNFDRTGLGTEVVKWILAIENPE